MDRINRILKKRWAVLSLITLVIVFLYIIFSNTTSFQKVIKYLWSLISPIVIGIIVAYLFNPVSEFFKKRLFKRIRKESSRHVCGVMLTIVCLLLVFTLLFISLVPSLAQSVTKLISNWNSYTVKMDALIEKADVLAKQHNINADLSGLENMIDNSMDKALEVVKNNAKNILTKIGEIGSGISNFAIGVIFGFCFLLSKKTLINLLTNIRRAIYTKEKLEKHDKLLGRCHKIFIRYIGCTLLDALIVGAATMIFMIATSMPYSPLISSVVMITNIIPTFGPMIGAVIGVFFLVLESPAKALGFLVFVCIIQSLDGMVIKPRLFSGSLGIPAAWTLVLIIFSGKVAGIAGILLAIPFAAIFVIIYNESIKPFLKQREKQINSNMTEKI